MNLSYFPKIKFKTTEGFEYIFHILFRYWLLIEYPLGI